MIATIALSFAQPVNAGTCHPGATRVTAKDQSKATHNAIDGLKNLAKSEGAKATQISTRCNPSIEGFTCIASGQLCPK
jgi:hypothetical protein